MVIEKALEKRRLAQEAANQRSCASGSADNIVGDSPALREVFEVVQRAAPTRANVLILGESGTGKESPRRCTSSPRKDHPFVRVNCGALTETLLESELFGHERGAFTERWPGARAASSAPMEARSSSTRSATSPRGAGEALRVLQTREFERVGGTETLKVDVRLLTATNKDLAAEVTASASARTSSIDSTSSR